MASDSVTPSSPSGGGSAKYIIGILLLLAGGLGVYFATGGGSTPPPAVPKEPVAVVERPTALADDNLQIPVDEPEPVDAGPAAVEPTRKTPRAAAGDGWSCEGDIAAPDIRKVLGDNQSAIRSCYERRLRNNNQLQGNVALQVKVGKDGRVDATRVSGSLRDGEVLKCIQGLAKGWSFPAPTGASCAVFDAPFQFTPKN